MPEFSQQWRIHIGAHKTATTHVQDLLALRRNQLAAIHIDYPTRAMLRDAKFKKCVRPAVSRLRDHPWLTWLRQRLTLRKIRSVPHAHTLLISEEQILGLSDELLVPVFYSNASARMCQLRRMTGGAPTTLLLSIRNPANIIPSAYSQCLRAGARGIPTLGQLREQALSQPPSWTHLVRRIRVAFPEAQLVVWRFEDYIANPGPYLDLISGTRLGNWPELASPESTRSLSAETVERILALETTLSRKERIARCAELAASDRGVRRFQPFSPEDITRLTQAYEADLAEMEREFPGVLHRLGT